MADTVYNAMKGLLRFFRQPSILSPLRLTVSEKEASGGTGSDSKDREIVRAIFGSSRGSFTASQIIEELKNAGASTDTFDLDQVPINPDEENINAVNGSIPVQVMTDDQGNLNLNGKIGDKNVSTITLKDVIGPVENEDVNAAVIMTWNPALTPAGRDLEAVELFFNSIPTIQFSLCQPYLSVEIHSGRSLKSGDGRASSMSLYKFLEGATTPEGANEFLAGGPGIEGEVPDPNGELVPITRGVAGMELFTSPQMMVNANEPDYNPNEPIRATQVIDRFRPFMTLKSFKVRVQSANAGMMSFKTAELDFILHDRSRLSDIVDLVNPELYQATEMLIEYGWSHPQGDDESNPYGVFLNSLRKREKYKIKNAKFSFDEVGQVNVSLELYLSPVAAAEIARVTSGENPNEVPLQKMITIVNRIQKLIRDLQIEKYGNDKGIADVLGSQIIHSYDDATNLPEISNELTKALNQLKKSASGSSSQTLKALSKEINSLYAKNDGVLKNERKNAGDAMKKKLEKITEEDSFDPFLPHILDPPGSVVDSSVENEEKTKTKNYVSLAKLILLFVVKPLLSSESPVKHKEIHLIFHQFNSRAGTLGETIDKGTNKSRQPANIGQFPIPIEHFKKASEILAKNRRTSAIPVTDFLDFILNEFIDDPTNPSYGISDLYDKPKFDKEGNYIQKPLKKFEKDLDDRISRALKDAGVPDGVFKMPLVGFHLEAYPVDGVSIGEVRGVQEPGDTILKIHVFDRVASPFELAINTLGSAKKGFLWNVYSSVPKNQQGALYELLSAQGLVDGPPAAQGAAAGQNQPPPEDPTPDPNKGGSKTSTKGTGDASEDIHVVQVSRAAMYDAIKKTVPTITYGTNATVIKNASVQSENDSSLSTIHMLRSGPGGTHIRPDGVGLDNVPLWTIPTSMNMTTLGCPLLEYAQQFFIDFQTGTSVDNIYAATTIEHTIEQGVFDTSVTWKFIDAYGQFRSMSKEMGSMLEFLEKEAGNDTPDGVDSGDST